MKTKPPVPTAGIAHTMDSISHLTQETTHGVGDTVETIGSLAGLSGRLSDAIGRFKIGKEQSAAAESRLPAIEGFPRTAENVTTSDEEIKLGFIE